MNPVMPRILVAASAALLLTAFGGCDRTDNFRPKTAAATPASPMQSADPTRTMGAAAAPRSGVREHMDDGQIVAALRARYATDDDIGAMVVDVDSKDGMVTLSGIVLNSEARARAGRMAGELKDVKSVNNQIEVKAG